MFRRLLASWGAQHRLAVRPTRPMRRLGVEWLEAREVPAVTLADIPDQPVTNNAPIFLPVTVSNTPNGPVSYAVTTSDPAVSANVVQGGRSVRFTVTGTNPDNTPFTGQLVIRLFEDSAPLATGRIIQLANSGFYNGKLFHRVSPGFTDPAVDTIIQGGSLNGNGTGGSGLGTLPDELNADFRFNSPGVVASANAGDDTTDQQFFIVRPSTPLDRRPQFLNFNYTVLGLLTAGADVYERINAVPRNGSTPVNPVTITAAEVFADPSNAVVRVNTQAGFTGSATLTVTPSDNDGPSAAETAVLTGATANPADGNRAFLGGIPTNLTTTAGQPTTFTVPVTDVDGSPVTIDVRDASFGAAPANVSISIDQSTRAVTLTPAAGFTGQINLRVGVRDDVNRAGTAGLNSASNFDTQALTLTVNPSGSTAPQAGVTLTADATSVTVGQPVTLTAGVTAAGVSNPQGTVEFRSGGTLLATAAVANGTASTVQTFNTVGTQPIVATFVPADNTVVTGGSSPTTSVTVSAVNATASSTSLSVNPNPATAGQATTLTATVTASGQASPAGTVEFRNGTTVLGTAPVANGSATLSAALQAGAQAVTATFVPTDPALVAGSTSQVVNVSVAAAPPAAGTPTTTTLEASTTSPAVGASVTLTATVASQAAGAAVAGSVRFLSDGVLLATVPVSGAGPATASTTTTFASAAARSLTAEFVPADATQVAGSTSPAVAVTVVGQPPLSAGITAVGARAGSPPRVSVRNADGTERVSILAYEESFTGGVRTAVADVTGDGVPDLVVVPAFGGSPLIKVFDTTTGVQLRQLMVFEESFRGGLTLATGDPGGLGYSRVLVGAGEGGGPRVTLYDFVTNKATLNFFAYDSGLRGGVSVSMGLLTGGTGADIVTGVGAGGGPQVNVYDGDDGTLLGSRQQGDPNDRGGIGVRVAPNPDGTGPAIFVTRDIAGGGPAVDPIDLSFINFGAGEESDQQDRIEEILNNGGGTTA